MGEFLVLEDNGRTPSGVSYVLKNRQVMKQVFPILFDDFQRASDRGLSDEAAGDVAAIAGDCGGDPTIAVLTPGLYNSAYYEHGYLATTDGGGAGGGARPVL